MTFDFDNLTLEFLSLILIAAKTAGVRVFFVGGIVRDNILNIKNSDIDLLIEGDAIQFSKKLPQNIIVKSLHPDFGTVKVEYHNLQIDIASTRKEQYPSSGCLPIVNEIGVKLEDDVLRRDFTVNSLYCELKLKDGKINYHLIDFVDGVNDIRNKVLKVLHNNSYKDDPTRILRGVNFKYRFGFDFSTSDKILIGNYLKNIDNKNASYDRIYNVFYKNFKQEFALDFFKDIIQNNYYKIIFDTNLKINTTKVFKTVNEFNIKKDELADFLIAVLKNDYVEKVKFETISDFKRKFSLVKNLPYYFYKTNDENVIKYKQIKNINVLINGNDLINLGYTEGRIFKQIFDTLLNEKIMHPDKFLSKDNELNFVKMKFPHNNSN